MNSLALKFLVDVGVGRTVEDYLRAQGYDTRAVRDMDPRMKDWDIIRKAVTENRMLVTMDKDFGELVYHSSMEHCGVLLFRLEDAPGEKKKLQVIKTIIENYSSHIRGCFCVFQKDKLRIRRRTRISA